MTRDIANPLLATWPRITCVPLIQVCVRLLLGDLVIVGIKIAPHPAVQEWSKIGVTIRPRPIFLCSPQATRTKALWCIDIASENLSCGTRGEIERVVLVITHMFVRSLVIEGRRQVSVTRSVHFGLEADMVRSTLHSRGYANGPCASYLANHLTTTDRHHRYKAQPIRPYTASRFHNQAAQNARLRCRMTST